MGAILRGYSHTLTDKQEVCHFHSVFDKCPIFLVLPGKFCK